ncbi:MAG TPA: OsmC family protein, partial [Steroidobacteraceae bacterium]|nr:OsmC family protein [Steroidobacteraceae bacterium]
GNMNANELRALQAPLKQKYRNEPASALVTSRAEAVLDPQRLTARLAGEQPRIAGLHPATGGAGDEACSADLLLESLVACAAVTLLAVATSMGAGLTGGKITAEGIWDARGTLGVDRSVPVGIRNIRLTFELEGSLDETTRQRLIQMTERYCVILATLRDPPAIEIAES